MGHRHFTNEFDSGINQGHNYNHSPAEQPIFPMGPIRSENPTSIYPVDNNMLRGGSNTDVHWTEGRANEYSSSNFRMQVQHMPPTFPTQPYDPYPRTSLATNLYPAPQINTGRVYSSYYNNRPPVFHDAEGRSSNPNRPPVFHDTEGRSSNPNTAISGSHKRKRPSFSETWEITGYRSRFSGAGSSSGSSQVLLENSTSDYQSIAQCHIGSARYGVSSQVSAEDMMRNVRSRSGLHTEPLHLPSYPSHHHYHSNALPRNPSGMTPLGHYADVTPQKWAPVPFSSTPHGRLSTSDVNGSSYEANRFFGGVGAGEVGSCHNDFVSSGHSIMSSQYLQGPNAHVTRDSGSYHSQRILPSYRTSLSYSQFGHEPAASMGNNGLHSQSESLSDRYSSIESIGGLHNGYRNGRSRIAAERLQSISTVMDSGSEFLMVGDHSPTYDGSRSSFDQYSDMRLDVDSMSYEELLALGERIGDVNTGVSENMMPNCLVEKLYCSADQKHIENNCAICLEEYKAGGGIGELKNCGHGYHVGCIRKWLLMKNVCPICKAAALNSVEV